jgi:uncharacterized membrane protein YuzA (DUF378 family)
MKWRILLRSLAAIGAINWGLIGLANFNLLTYLFGSLPNVERIMYLLVGAAGLYSLFVYVSLLLPKPELEAHPRKV